MRHDLVVDDHRELAENLAAGGALRVAVERLHAPRTVGAAP